MKILLVAMMALTLSSANTCEESNTLLDNSFSKAMINWTSNKDTMSEFYFKRALVYIDEVQAKCEDLSVTRIDKIKFLESEIPKKLIKG